MTPETRAVSVDGIQHAGEPASNEVRQRLAAVEPRAQRTYTPSQAVIARSAGCYHWTPEGRRLADFTSGVLVANLGHNPARWWQRVAYYMEWPTSPTHEPFTRALPLTSYNAVTPLEVEACERLVASMRQQPGGGRMEQVLWAASGSEAIQKALWAALRYRPGAEMVLATRRGFHGKKGLAGAVTGCEHDPERDPRVRFLAFPQAECRDTAARREPLDLAPYAEELAALADELGTRIGCVITEPYLGGGGSYHPQPEYLQLLQRFCRERDAVLILDEIQSNFGRTGTMYAYSRYGIEPDLVCLGKGLGNGIPVSATVGRADVLGRLHYGEGSDTWSAHPLAAAAVLATLDEFESEDVLRQAARLSEVLAAGLEALRDTGVVAHIRGEGCVWGVECGEFAGRSPSEIANLCVEACYRGDEQGRAIHLLGPLAGSVLRVSPPLVMPLDEARLYLAAMQGILARLAQALQPTAP